MVAFYSAGILTGIIISVLGLIAYFVLFFGTSNPTPMYVAVLGVAILILSLGGDISLNRNPRKSHTPYGQLAEEVE